MLDQVSFRILFILIFVYFYLDTFDAVIITGIILNVMHKSIRFGQKAGMVTFLALEITLMHLVIMRTFSHQFDVLDHVHYLSI